MSEQKKIIPTTESVIENLTVTIKDNLKEFKEKQILLVKENPFIEIVDTKTYEAAKKSRTTLVSGRTNLQKQLTVINGKLNPVKSFVKTEIESLIEVSKPAEELQQAEVKRFEAIQDEKRIERERIAEEKKEKIKGMIDEIISDWTKSIKELSFEKIKSFQSEFEEFFEKIDCSKFEDLEIHFDVQFASLKTVFETRIKELKKDQELLVSQSENRFQQFKSKWMERLMNANINNIRQLNIDFDTEVPEIDPDTFFTFKDQFIEETKKFRSKLIDTTNYCKLQQDKADEESRKETVKGDIKRFFQEIELTVGDTTFEKMIPYASEISKSIDEIRANKDYDEFKDLIELNISKIENLSTKRNEELVAANQKFEAAEKIRIAKEKEDEKNRQKEQKKNDNEEKKRQKELKPEKDSAVNEINYFTPVKEFNCENTEISKVVQEFFSELKTLQEKSIEKINNL